MSPAKDFVFRRGPVSCREIRFACALLLAFSVLAPCQQPGPRPDPREPKGKSGDEKLADDEKKKAIETVKHIADTIRNCGEESEVRRTTGKKPLFYRVHEGPPSAIRFDLQKSDSIMAPYLGIVEFSTYHGATPYSTTPEQAAVDKREGPLIFSWTTRHRHIFRILSDGFELDNRTYYNDNDQKWYLEDWTPASCWERVGYRFGPNEPQ